MTDIVTYCDVNTCEDCPRYGDDCDGTAERLYTHDEAWGMTDLISRADALEQMAQAECGLHYDDCEADNCSCSYIQRILDIPSADAVHIETYRELYERYVEIAKAVQGCWIPCSERLPSESGEYLCTIPLDEVDTYTEVLTFHKGRFYEDDAEWGATYYDDVLAWTPLPKPYREDGEA